MNYLVRIMLLALGGALALLIGEGVLTDQLTEQAVQAEVGVAASDTAAFITLDTQNWYNDLTGMTVTSDLDGTLGASNLSMGADRITLSLTGLTSDPAGHAITITHLTETTGAFATQLNVILKMIPVLIALGIIGGMFFSAATGGAMGGGMAQGGITALLGIITLGIVTTFTTQASDVYSAAPEYVAVTVGLVLIPLGYLFAVGIGVFNQFGGKRIFSRMG